MDSTDILVRAHELIGEYGICRNGSYASDENGEGVASISTDARAFCSVGAITRASYDLGIADPITLTECAPYHEALAVFKTIIGTENITSWNDDTATDEQIKAAFARAAGKEQPEPTPETPVESEELVAA